MNSRDPTRSAGLRRRGRGLVHRKLFDLHRQLHSALQEHDVVGLRRRDDLPGDYLLFTEARENKLIRADMMLAQIISRTLASPPEWLRVLIKMAVDKGVEQAGKELRTELLLDPQDVVGPHAFAAAAEIEGITAETQRRVLRHVVQAVERERSPDELMRQVRTVLEKITRVRLVMLVNNAVVRGVNAGKLLSYENLGIKQVGIDPEWVQAFHLHDRDTKPKAKAKPKPKAKAKPKAKRKQVVLPPIDEELVNVLTAGDDRVCDECDTIAAQGPYDIDAARDLIPAHINCRCAFVPWDDKRFAAIEEQDE